MAPKDDKKETGSVQVSVEDFIRTRDSRSARMSEPAQFMTAEQHRAAVESVDLLTEPLKNVSTIAFQIARHVTLGAMHPHQNVLMSTPQVVTGLATLQSAVQDLSRAYIAHTNTVIGKGPGSSLELLNFTNPLSDNSALFGGARLATPGDVDAAEGKKKRKRAPHDKNAPKRALTPYFLYMQSERSKIAEESGAKGKEVADEGTKRWNSIAPEDKKKWEILYQINLARYREEMRAYKAGLPIPKISEADAKRLYQEHLKAGTAQFVPQDPAEVQLEEELDAENAETAETATSDDSDEEEEEEAASPTPVPAREPSPPKAARTSRKSVKDRAERLSSVKVPETVETPKSPEKKEKKKATKKKDDVGSAKKETAAEPASLPTRASIQESSKTDKKSKKKRKTGPVDDE